MTDALFLPDAARRLKLSYAVVYRLVLTGELEAERVGTRWQISRRAVERLAKALQRVPGRHRVVA